MQSLKKKLAFCLTGPSLSGALANWAKSQACKVNVLARWTDFQTYEFVQLLIRMWSRITFESSDITTNS